MLMMHVVALEQLSSEEWKCKLTRHLKEQQWCCACESSYTEIKSVSNCGSTTLVPSLHVTKQQIGVEVAKQLNDKDFVVGSCKPKSHPNQPNNNSGLNNVNQCRNVIQRTKTWLWIQGACCWDDSTIMAFAGHLKRALMKKHTCRN